MRGGLRCLINPATRLGDVDLAATRLDRARLHDELRERQLVACLLRTTVPGDELVHIRRELAETPETRPDPTRSS